MSYLQLRGLLIALSLTITPAASQAQTQAKVSKATGSVAGRVTVKNKGIAGVLVSLRGTDNFGPFDSMPRAISDGEGNYKITGVMAGSYSVMLTSPAYVSSDLSLRPKTVVVGEGEVVDHVDLALIRGAVITGKITDAQGDPVIEQEVRLFRADPSNAAATQGDAFQFPVNGIQTDDRGIYRMFGLIPGRYKVSVGRSEQYTGSFTGRGGQAYREVYYPNTSDKNKASIVEVSEGSEAANIDIQLDRPIETFSVKGRVVMGETGQPAAGQGLGVQRVTARDSEYVNNMVWSNTQGEFEMEGLIPGTYAIFLSSSVPNELRPDSTTFDIINADVSGVTVRLVRGASISGVVILESDNKGALAKLSEIEVQAFVQPTSGLNMNSGGQSPVATDGTFRIVGLAGGTAHINISSRTRVAPLKGFLVSRIELGGVAQPRGIELKEGEQLSDVRVFVSYGSATLRGTVTTENGPLPDASRVSLRLTRLGGAPLPFRPPAIDERGHFMVDGLPAGSYELWVTISGPNLKPKQPTKQVVTLQDGAVTDVEFKLDLNPVPKP